MAEQFSPIKSHFQFACTQCADCCTGSQTVPLNLYDLFKLARFRQLQNTVELFQQRLVTLQKDPERAVYRPFVRFKTRPFKFCPFLINEVTETGTLKGWCQLHPEYKPLVCALSPVGVRYDSQSNRTQFLLVPPTIACPGMKQPTTHQLETYLQPFKQEINWQNTFFRILEKTTAFNWNAENFKKQLYTFSVQVPFEQTLTRLMNTFLK